MKRLLLLFLSSLMAMEVFALTGYEIMQKVDQRKVGDYSKSNSTMILIDEDGNQRERKLVTFSSKKDGIRKSLMFFDSPADMKGTGFLSYNYDDPTKDTDQWLYLPALSKVKRIASGDRGGSFLGSDFNYSDLTGFELEDYDFNVVEEEKVEKYETYKIDALPKSEPITQKYGYRKATLWVVKDIWIMIKAQNYLLKEGETKRMIGKDLKQIDGVWTLQSTKMTTYQGKKAHHSTIMLANDTQYNVSINDDIFTERQLSKGL